MVDDIGMLPVGEDAAEGFYRLVDDCYEKRSLAVSSNLHPAGFDELMPKTLATATVDRLLHHAHICVTEGESFRLPSHRRQGGDHLAHLIRTGKSHVRQWGASMTARGEIS